MTGCFFSSSGREENILRMGVIQKILLIRIYS